MKLAVYKEFPYSRVGSWAFANPYAIAYCYPKDRKPFIVKGGLKDVYPYLAGLDFPMVVHNSLWRQGKSRSFAYLHGVKELHLGYNFKRLSSRRTNRDPKFALRDRLTSENVKTFRRIPRSWIREIDQFMGS